jgi:hypothetical protein
MPTVCPDGVDYQDVPAEFLEELRSFRRQLGALGGLLFHENLDRGCNGQFAFALPKAPWTYGMTC